MYYILYYNLVENYKIAREAYRAAHFQHVLAARERDEFIMGGAFDDEKQAALVFKVDDPVKIDTFVTNDPYVTGGVVTGWSYRKWNVAITENTILS